MTNTATGGTIRLEVAMIYEEYPPSAQIFADVEAFWRFQLDAHEPERLRHVIPPDGAVNLCLRLGPDGGAFVSAMGPSDRASVVEVERGAVYVGARLRPGGRLRAPGAAPKDLAHGFRIEPDMEPALAAWLKAALAPLVDGDAEATVGAFAAWPFAKAPRDAAVEAVVERMIATHGAVRIERAAEDVGTGERTLRRRFAAAVGLSPKTFARLRRLRRACVLGLEAGARLAQTSAEAGYADQAHLSREMLESFGAPPAAVAAYLRQIRHAFARA